MPGEAVASFKMPLSHDGIELICCIFRRVRFPNRFLGGGNFQRQFESWVFVLETNVVNKGSSCEMPSSSVD